MMTSDLDLLRQYALGNSEEAFAALVHRHLNLVYSAALRQVRSPQLAEEVAQSVFTDLARNVHKLKPDTILTAWLYQVTRRTAVDLIRRESRRQLREQIATEMNAMNSQADSGTGFQPVWADIEPIFDEAMESLDDTDRAAVLLRYFENKSLREVGQTLGSSEDAAQKRVSRALERLREFLSKRGVSVGASGLAVVLSANAVQAAPAGLAVTISTAAALAGTTLATTATVTATKAIAMTTLQKAIIGATLAAAVGAGMYQANQASNLRSQVQRLKQQQAPVAERILRFQQERDDATNRLARLAEENATLKNNSAELMKLRGEVGALRRQNQELLQAQVSTRKDSDAQTLKKGFGTLGEFLPIDGVSDLGNSTAEALVQTFLWAMREGKAERLAQIGAPFGGQSKPGDVAGEISDSQAAVFKTLQNVFTNSAGFRLSSSPENDGQKYLVRLDAEPLQNNEGDPFLKSVKNFYISFVLEQKADGWRFGVPSEETPSPSK